MLGVSNEEKCVQKYYIDVTSGTFGEHVDFQHNIMTIKKLACYCVIAGVGCDLKVVC